MRIEILHSRDPDSSCDLTVFVDGVPTTDYSIEDIDPGAGYEREDWDARFELPDHYSPAFRDATLEALGGASDSPYIEAESTTCKTQTRGRADVKDMTIWATPSNTDTAAALTPTTRDGDVEITITRAEYDAEQDLKWETPKFVPGPWSPAVDITTGKAVHIRAISCGGDCKCAMEVRLA